MMLFSVPLVPNTNKPNITTINTNKMTKKLKLTIITLLSLSLASCNGYVNLNCVYFL